MRYFSRRSGSQRTSRGRTIFIEPNFAGQGGEDCIVYREERIDMLPLYHFIIPETLEDVRELQRQAAILAHNFKE